MSKFTAVQLETLNKVELRELCRDNHIGYNGLNNEGMRAALLTVPGGDEGAVQPAAEPVVAEVPAAPQPVELPPVIAPPPPVAAKRTVQVGRPERNGVKRPSEGTICAQIWAWCDAQFDAHGKAAAKDLKAAKPNLDATTCTVQFYRWRKFNGIQGRA